MDELNENLLKNDVTTITSPISPPINVSKVKFVLTLDFLESLNLKYYAPNQIQGYSKKIGAFIYFFKVSPSEIEADSYM